MQLQLSIDGVRKLATRNFSCCGITESTFPCLGSCGTPVCEGDKEELIKGGSSTNGQSVSGEEGVLLAGTSVFVLKPGEKRGKRTLRTLTVYSYIRCYLDITLPFLASHRTRTERQNERRNYFTLFIDVTTRARYRLKDFFLRNLQSSILIQMSSMRKRELDISSEKEILFGQRVGAS